MKILVTTDPEIPVPPLLYGGAERIADYLLKGLKNENFTTVLLSNSESKSSYADKLYSWPSNKSRGLFNTLRNSLALIKCIKNENPDIIYCFSRVAYIYLPAIFWKKTFIKRYGRYISPHSNKIANLLLKKRIHYVALANHMVEHLPLKEKYEIIPNCVDFNFYDDDTQRNKDYLFFLGRIEPIKGTYEAIIVAKKTNQKLVIAGNIPDDHIEYFKNKIEPELNDNIKYVGAVDNIKKRELLQGAKAMLFPINLNVEAFGIVMIESLACGTPVLGFNIAAVPEVIKNDVNGFVCKDIDEMVARICDISKINRKELRDKSRMLYSIEAVISKHIHLFEKLDLM